MNSIKDIKEELNQINKLAKFKNSGYDDEINSFVLKYTDDNRSGVKTILNKANKLLSDYIAEINRIEQATSFENKYNNYSYICGIDEVGRGPLAGPVVAGAVILPKDCDILYINDSKKLTKNKREELYNIIKEQALAVSTAFVSHEDIDELNILQATYKAMRLAISKLEIKPDLLLNDAVTIPDVNIEQVPIIKGDAKSISIGAASIIAKVERDRFMEECDLKYPGYGFASNMGYGSAKHIQAIKEQGPCPIHRKTFIKNFVK